MTFARIAACAALVTASVAHADPHPAVALDIDGCVDAPVAEIRRVVGVELGALLDTGESTADRTRVSVTCAGGAVVLRVDDPITAKSLARTIAIADAPAEARGRLIALAIAELVSASWTELEINPVPRVPATGPRPSVGARDAALAAVLARSDRSTDRTLDRSVRLDLEAGTAKFFGGTGMLSGGGLRIAADTFDPLGWVIAIDEHHGSRTTQLGDVVTDVLAVGAFAAVHHRWNAWNVHLGGGVRGGAVELAGVGASGAVTRADRFWAPWFGVGAFASVGVRLAKRFVVEATLEGGDVTLPVGALVDGQRVVAVDGGWLALNVGLGFFL